MAFRHDLYLEEGNKENTKRGTKRHREREREREQKDKKTKRHRDTETSRERTKRTSKDRSPNVSTVVHGLGRTPSAPTSYGGLAHGGPVFVHQRFRRSGQQIHRIKHFPGPQRSGQFVMGDRVPHSIHAVGVGSLAVHVVGDIHLRESETTREDEDIVVAHGEISKVPAIQGDDELHCQTTCH